MGETGTATAAANANVMGSLTEKITQIMTAPDTTNSGATSNTSYLAFCSPGVAILESDLAFGDMSTKAMVNANSAFSQLANNIPNSQGFWGPTAKKVWDIYQDAITNIQLPIVTLTAQQQKELTNAQNFLVQQVTNTDPITGNKSTVIADSAAYAAYKLYQTAYISALTNYNGLQIQANAPGASNAVVQAWSANGPALQQLVVSAFGAWTADGYKAYVEEALGVISNLAGQGPQALYQTLLANFNSDKKADTLGNQFFPTYVYPPNPLNPALSASWLAYEFNLTDIQTFQSSSQTNSGGSAGVSWGLWSASASAEYSSGSQSYDCDTTGLGVSVDLLQVPLTRAWLRPEIFWSRGWKFSPAAGLGQVSDGASPPQGLMPLYPTAVILAQNLEITLDMTNEKNSSSFSSISTKASFGWGPFSVSGNYSNSQAQAQKSYTQTDSGISVPGPQIIAFVCEVIPLSPNPDPSLAWPK